MLVINGRLSSTAYWTHIKQEKKTDDDKNTLIIAPSEDTHDIDILN